MEKLNNFQAAALAITVAATPVVAEAEHTLTWDENNIACGVASNGGIGDAMFHAGLKGHSMEGFIGLEEATAALNEYAKVRIDGFMNPNGYHEIRTDQSGALYFGVQGFLDIDPGSGERPNAGCVYKFSDPQL